MGEGWGEGFPPGIPAESLSRTRYGAGIQVRASPRESRALAGGGSPCRALPRKTDLATLAPARFTELVQAYNNTPRKCLGYQTPAEGFWDQLLHLKCESTFPASAGMTEGFAKGSFKGEWT